VGGWGGGGGWGLIGRGRSKCGQTEGRACGLRRGVTFQYFRAGTAGEGAGEAGLTGSERSGDGQLGCMPPAAGSGCRMVGVHLRACVLSQLLGVCVCVCVLPSTVPAGAHGRRGGYGARWAVVYGVIMQQKQMWAAAHRRRRRAYGARRGWDGHRTVTAGCTRLCEGRFRCRADNVLTMVPY
jgi:hypothetical protein